MFFEKVKLNLEKRGFKVNCFQTGTEAADYLNHQIDGKTVGFGGSMTTCIHSEIILLCVCVIARWSFCFLQIELALV